MSTEHTNKRPIPPHCIYCEMEISEQQYDKSYRLVGTSLCEEHLELVLNDVKCLDINAL